MAGRTCWVGAVVGFEREKSTTCMRWREREVESVATVAGVDEAEESLLVGRKSVGWSGDGTLLRAVETYKDERVKEVVRRYVYVLRWIVAYGLRCVGRGLRGSSLVKDAGGDSMRRDVLAAGTDVRVGLRTLCEWST